MRLFLFFITLCLAHSSAFAQIVDDESGIVDDESGIVDDESGIVDDESGIVDDESGIVDDESGIVDDESGIVDDESGIVDDESGIVDDTQIEPKDTKTTPSDAEEKAPKEASAPTSPVNDVTTLESKNNTPRFGEAIPLSRREPLLKALTLGVNLRYGLVGSGPTRFVDDIRFGVTDWFELRTSVFLYPSSLMARIKLFNKQSKIGALVIDGGLANFDAGFRLVVDEGEPQVGLRAHFEGGLAHDIALGDRFSLYTAARYRVRVSGLADDNQQAITADTQLTYDLTKFLFLSGGVGFAMAFTPVREVAVNFVETGRPGMNHVLLRDDGHQQSVTIPLALTYGRTESFDVDIFCTPRIYPVAGVVFGAGLRWRLGFGKKKKVDIDETPAAQLGASL